MGRCRPAAVGGVNVSARTLLDLDFPAEVDALLARHRVPPSRLEIEITKSTIMADPVRALRVLTELERRGVRLAIDDFGTGYSSMAYLKRLRVHELKIDRAFVTDLPTSTSDAAIVTASVQLARALGLRVVAEGVETELTWRRLAALGCDAGQGYHLARPMPADALSAWLVTRARVPAVAAG